MKPNPFAVCEANTFIRQRRVNSGGQWGQRGVGSWGQGGAARLTRNWQILNSKICKFAFRIFKLNLLQRPKAAGNRTKECSKFIYKYNCNRRGSLCVCVYVWVCVCVCLDILYARDFIWFKHIYFPNYLLCLLPPCCHLLLLCSLNSSSSCFGIFFGIQLFATNNCFSSVC